ncbi:hypothetical protein [Persicobacter diffluens]|uniref:Novel STAND NTPase 1 domain-containing protein n=1 Tax=Persicobacter diffluens TaxID=981 RepID=A0AAN4W386_9BACT|nr:hypothetical protein PEDI_39890 [Persicobacter diffluens]
MEILHQKSAVEQGELYNPYPGLRPFNMDEHHLFFGREHQSDEVVSKLWQHQFVSIVGNSGIGKSSFVYCGAIPTLLADHGGEEAWLILNYRFGDHPVRALSQLLAEKMEQEGMEVSVEGLEENLLHDKDSLRDVLQKLKDKTGKRILLFIDQFEELFRFRVNQEEEAYFFVEMLLHCQQAEEHPLYTVLTIRSDFVGDCAQFPNLTQEINKSQFLIPQMTREERRRAIEQPLKYIGVDMAPEVVEEVLEHMGEKGDHLPIMQHAMMRTFDYWREVNRGQGQISLKHYRAIGTMEQAMSLHANEVYNSLDENGQKVCQGLFKTITEKRGEGRGIRKPTPLHEIAEVLNETESAVIEVVEAFRKPGTTLLMPSSAQPLESETMVDISHESLMRIWEMLRIWVDEESESVKMYLRLAEAAEMHQNGSSGLWLPPDLDLAVNWKKQEKPTMAWGVRYHKAYERTMLFLEYSEQEYERFQLLKEKQQKRRLMVARIVAGVLFMGIVVALLFLFYAEQQRRIAAVKSAEAELQRDSAEQSAIRAKLSALKADSAMVVAQYEAERAVQQSEFAKEQQSVAEEKGRQAQIAEQLAVMEGEKAYRLRLLSVARSMAIKSRQISDSTTQGLVAQQAFNFFANNGGKMFDPDIYNGLYYGLKRLKPEAYNVLEGHQFNVRAISSTSSREDIFSAGSDGKILQWKGGVYEMVPEVIFDDRKLVHQAMAVSENGRYLLAGGAYPYLLFFDLTNGFEPEKIPLKGNESWRIDFGNHDRYAAVLTSSGELYKFNIQEKALEFLLKKESKINTMAMHPTLPLVITGNTRGEVHRVELASASENLLFKRNTSMITLAMNKKGSRLACGAENGVVYLYHWARMHVAEEFRGHKSRVNNLSFNTAGNRLASGSFDRTVRLWDLDFPKDQPVILDDHKDWVWSIGFSGEDDFLLAGCKDNLIRKWPAKTEQMAREMCQLLPRDLSQEEWKSYVAEDIPFEQTCQMAQELSQLR